MNEPDQIEDRLFGLDHATEVYHAEINMKHTCNPMSNTRIPIMGKFKDSNKSSNCNRQAAYFIARAWCGATTKQIETCKKYYDELQKSYEREQSKQSINNTDT